MCLRVSGSFNGGVDRVFIGSEYIIQLKAAHRFAMNTLIGQCYPSSYELHAFTEMDEQCCGCAA